VEWRLVLDTMVWVSAGINERGAPGAIVRLAGEGELRLVTSRWIHEEVVATFPEVARYWSRATDPLDWLAAAETFADVLGEIEGPPITVDPEDDPILWAAYVGAATHVVTKDPALLEQKHYREAQIVTPPDFLRAWRGRR
jgi:putative PIN family toxin of toxin-antitoxin system